MQLNYTNCITFFSPLLTVRLRRLSKPPSFSHLSFLLRRIQFYVSVWPYILRFCQSCSRHVVQNFLIWTHFPHEGSNSKVKPTPHCLFKPPLLNKKKQKSLDYTPNGQIRGETKRLLIKTKIFCVGRGRWGDTLIKI